MFASFFIRAYLYFIGLRFFEPAAIPQSAAIVTQKAELVSGQLVHLRMYRELGEDRVIRFGRIRVRPFIGYILECRSDDSTVNELIRCNRINFVFHGERFKKIAEDEIWRVLSDLYLTNALLRN